MEYVVSKAKREALKAKMEQLGIKSQEIEEKFVRSQGKGGQKVNKTATCVYLKHIPSQIEVKCQETRSQSVNRFLALRILVEKIEERLLGKESAVGKEREKIRKQKIKRSKRAKSKTLPPPVELD